MRVVVYQAWQAGGGGRQLRLLLGPLAPRGVPPPRPPLGSGPWILVGCGVLQWGGGGGGTGLNAVMGGCGHLMVGLVG